MPKLIIALIVLVVLAVIILLSFLFCLYPGKRRSIAPFDRIKYAHRGLHDDLLPENSIAAFRAAKEAGFGVELDIQFTADKQIVVFHDSDLARMCGVNKRVDSLTYDELQQYTLLHSDQRIPLLSDVLNVLGTTPVVCEIKSYGAVMDCSLCEAAYPLLQSYTGPLCVESFNPFIIRWFRKKHPNIVRGILSMHYDDESGVSRPQQLLLTALLTNCITHPDFIAFRHTDHRVLSLRICRNLFRAAAIAWTVRSSAEQKAALRRFDTVIFEKYLPEN